MKSSPAHRLPARTSGIFFKALGLALLGFVLTIGSAAANLVTQLQGNIREHDVDHLFDAPRPTVAPPVDSSAGSPLNYLILGSDARDGSSDVDGAGAAGEVTGMRSDTTMIMHISADRKRVDVVSIPRDTLVPIPSCILSDGRQTRPQSEAMFNSAFQTGGIDGDVAAAAACAIRTVEDLTDVYIDGFAVVNFASFQDIVNTLGGVEICLSEEVYDVQAGLDLPAGCQVLDGQNALALSRARKSLGDGSDIGRIGRQQQIVSAIMNKALSLDFVSDLPTLYRVLQDVTANVDLSSGLGDITYLSGLAYSLTGLNTENINFVTMPWIPEGPRVRPARAAADVWEALRTDQPLPRIEDADYDSPILGGTEAEREEAARLIGSGVRYLING